MSADPRLLELLDAELDGLLDAAGATELAGRLAADPRRAPPAPSCSDARRARAPAGTAGARRAALP
jgi:anti-sigma factor RsiW